MRKIDLTGERFGKLVVVSQHGKSQNGLITWDCKCDCGNKVVATGKYLRNGKKKSCGCYIHEFKRGNAIHNGASKERLYYTWRNMLDRCTDPKNKEYKNYGGRGIKVCDMWGDSPQGYLNFKKWAVENGFSENANGDDCSIDRINTNGNYSPENCRWVDRITQQNNMRSNNLVTYCGETHSIRRWSVISGIPYSTLYYRLKTRNYSPQMAFATE